MLLFLACTGSPANAPAANGGDTLVIAYQASPNSMLSMTAQAASDHDLIDNIFLHLLEVEFDCGLNFKPGLATKWEFNDAGDELRMWLRDDVVWSDGQPFTADDVAFTIELTADKLVASPRMPATKHMVPGSMPEVVGPHEVLFKFDHAYDRNTMLAHVNEVRPAPKHALVDADRGTLRGHAFGRDPVVNGPWRIDDFSPDERLVLVPAANAELGLNRVIVKVLPEYATRVMELENGSVDWAQSLQIEDADRIRDEHPEIRLVRRGWRSTDYIVWDTTNPMFADPVVRNALSSAIDVDKMIADLLTSKTGEAYGKRAVSSVSPALCGSHNNDIQPLPFDTEVARAKFAEAGWTDTNGDGTLDKDGQDFAFTLLTNSGNPRRARAAILIQANLAEVGVKMEISKLESNTFFSTIRKKEFEAALSGWVASDYVDLSGLWHSGEEYAQNYASYNNPEVDALIDAALSEPDPDIAATHWKEVQALVYADQPYTFLFWRDDIIGVHERFDDATVDFVSPLRNLDGWSVPPDKVKYPN
jgi:peptide/nickel transport system substrate-binding protein